MISIAAQESGLDEEFISDLNKNAPNMLSDLYLSTDAVKQAIIAQEKIIRKIADSGVVDTSTVTETSLRAFLVEGIK